MFNLRSKKYGGVSVDNRHAVSFPQDKRDQLQAGIDTVIDSLSRIASMGSESLASRNLSSLVSSVPHHVIYASLGLFAIREPKHYSKIVKMLQNLGIQINE